MKKIKRILKNNKHINNILEKIDAIRKDEETHRKLRKIKELMFRTFFLILYNWKKVIIGVFALLTIAVNTNIENIIKKLTIPPFFQGFIDYINSIFNLITFNKFEINSIYIFIYVLEIMVWCGIIYILDKYFRLKNKHQKKLRKIKGFVNAENEYPYLIGRERNKINYKILDETYNANAVPIEEWKEKQTSIETTLNRVIVDIKQMDGTKDKICVSSISPKYKVPNVIEWKDSFLSPQNSVLVLGENLLGKIIVDINKTPHILTGGTTGSGKSVLTENLIYQCHKKGYIVYIGDIKEVDFKQWLDIENIHIATDIKTLYEKLSEIDEELKSRKINFANLGVRNINEFNSKYANRYGELKRIVFVCDEVAEIFNGENEKIKKIEEYLSRIARLGRAFRRYANSVNTKVRERYIKWTNKK